MLTTIREFFEKNILLSAPDEGALPIDRQHVLQYCNWHAALFIEMTRMDHEIKESERDMVRELLRGKFSIDAETCERLLGLAEDEARNAVDYYQFTSLINGHFDYEKKRRIIEYLWEIAYADRNLDKHEEHLVRKLADLLYIRHADFIAAKHRALNG